ncbi:MAG: beta-N-acetylhexosaminidase [Nitrospinaceae bacterium]|jgi:beta-N-acetylhexosaminidase|nr:beta-N-acetylhexosaminidase [Nitrospinaceae bacterium]MBT3434929.1 beta-N-acetylhexosaminidase [Nitrospinaceae bacterium]MBT6395308.1 beta-N-acetylhexosaminidase [Nitrospinaceae bacterium]MBT7858332.1 beta-N-acetylhexosaminidase [Nitrospinaceae bacterium]
MPHSKWTPEEKAGSHIMAGFPGRAAPASLLERIQAGRVGGVILFSRNIESAPQVIELTHSLQKAAADGKKPPLLIAIDQEGGRVSRLSADFTIFPPARVLGRIGDLDLISRCARATATELRAVGINTDFAPVYDILTNPECEVIGDRAFSEDAETVAQMASAAATGLQAGGVAASAKHFPGIGDMAPDPHETLPYSNLSIEDLRARELIPFRAAAGVASVMIAHAIYEQIDPERPASLSPRFMKTLLRDELDYVGVAITDDLEMGAIDDPVGAAPEALAAGADIALICHSEDVQERAHEEIKRALQEEALPAAEENISLDRIARMRSTYAIATQGGPGDLEKQHKNSAFLVGCEAHRALLDEAISRDNDRAPS